jgi:NAD(P)-dependent dehydrogenase (short-subunit alcohol dehydrogenase family)
MENTNQEQMMQGKICLITGASRGIGRETAAGLALLGAQVIIVSQDLKRCQAAQDQVNKAYGEGSAVFYVADLSSQDEIHMLASKIQRDYDQIDVLINNVGGWFSKFQRSPEGYEMTFALNHLSYFLLSGLLLPLLQKPSSARIINVSSDAHRQAKGIQFDDINFTKRFQPFLVYAHSKLANVLFTYELARRLEGSHLTVNALHPGLVKTELYRHFGALTPLVNMIAGLFGKSLAEGAQTPIYLASSTEVEGISGKYFIDCKPSQSSPISYDLSQAKRLWQISEALTGFSYPT